MFYLNKDIELTPVLLEKMLTKFRGIRESSIKVAKEYYDGIQAIKNKHYTDTSKPCNKTVINYCKNIVDSYCGYLATPGYISYSSDQDIEAIMDIMRYNDYQAEDSNLLLDALIHGVANELMYIDNFGKTRFRLINPQQCFGIYDDSLSGDLLYFVRFYKVNEWDETDTTHNIDVYTDTEIRHYTMSSEAGIPTPTGSEPHYFGQCPANILVMPDEKSIFDCIKGLQDSINTLLSAEIDDYQAFCDAYLTLEGADADDDYAAMKENRILILPQGAKASWLTKNANDAQVENMLKRIHDSIYRIAACVDFGSETFTGGVSSGIAIQFKLSGMETRCGKIEAEMRKALQRRVEIIAGIASLSLGEEVWRDIQIEFKRNVPADEANLINSVMSLKGLVSDETLLAQLPFISDPAAELERVKKQRQDNQLYAVNIFGTGEDTEEEDEENLE